MLNNKKVCVFVDGENLRHSIGDLFPDFNRTSYIPKADWTKFFNWISCEVAGRDAERIRTYWYVVQNIDFAPANINAARKDMENLERILLKDSERAKQLSKITIQEKRNALIEQMADDIQEIQGVMEKRFDGWTYIQNSIAQNHTAIEFRRAGSIRYDLFKKVFGSEKAVDIKLAIDLIKLKDIYDIAIIVSGDQDYVPAVDAIKDFGKHTVNVAFRTENGYLLPSGAKRLNQSTDWSIEIKHSDLKNYLNL